MANAESRLMPNKCLDKNISRLTSFPIPGSLSSTLQESKNSNSAVPPAKTYSSLASAKNQYWMPDHLCKVCYECSTAFSLFRRRHHCRLCGQIFCYECSNNFIDGTPHDFPSAIRVCTFCLQFADETVKGTTEVMISRQNLLQSPSRAEMSEDSLMRQSDKFSSHYHFGLVDNRKPSPLVFVPPNHRNEVSSLLSPVDTNISDSGDLQQSAELTTLVINPAKVFSGSTTHQKHHSQANARNRHLSAELLDAFESGGLMEVDGITSKSGYCTDIKVQKHLSSSQGRNLYTQREIVLDKYMHIAHDRIRDGINKILSALSNGLSELESFDLDQLASTLEDMAFVVTGHLLFSMKFRSASGFNYSNLVKVKSIALPATVQTKQSYNFKWLAGTVCHKHLSHKQMARQIVNPRIMLFGCGISYDRSNGAGRMSSLDTLLEQERSYMAILVDKITALEPDVIFVEKTVSRYAQELLCERRIAIVLNVKCEVLRRIARHVGAKIIPTVDHVDKVNPAHVIGHCRSFVVESIPVISDEGLSIVHQPLQALADVSIKAQSIPNRLRTDTYLYLDGCDPLNGCTVLITGPLKQSLRTLKRMTRSILSMTYQLLLEAHVLSDFNLSDSLGTTFIETQRSIWCTTSTLRVCDPGSANPRYHQCAEAKHLCITACSDEDVSFGNFLIQELSALSLKCRNVKCSYLMANHIHTFSCRTGTIVISFEELTNLNKQSLPISKGQVHDTEVTEHILTSSSELSRTMGSGLNASLLTARSLASINQTTTHEDDCGIATDDRFPAVIFWRWCRECKSYISPFIPLKRYIYKYSFARFLEVLFMEAEGSLLPISSSSTCVHTSLESHVLLFSIGNSVARFDVKKQVVLRLSRVKSNCSTDECFSWEMIERAAVNKEVVTRLESLKWQLKSIVESFEKKVQEIYQAVDALELSDFDHHHARLILEIMCISKILRSGHATFTCKFTQLEPESASSLADCDATQRALYVFACKWITCMVRLREIIKQHLSPEPASSVPICNSSTPGGNTFDPVDILAPMRSHEEFVLTPSAIAQRPHWIEGSQSLARCRSSAALSSLIKPEPSTQSAGSFSSTIASFDSFKRLSIPYTGSTTGVDVEKEKSGRKDALLDLYRILGQSDPQHDITINLPDALIAGHPSLPNLSKSRVVLVDETIPITFVAYALSTYSYEEELDGWKLQVHNEAAESVVSEISMLDCASTNWSRAALETKLDAPFKFTAIELPLHVSLLSCKPSLSVSSSWEMSMVAYCPLQFEILRELFCGDLPDFVLSISHVMNWDANGGKSGASFYRSFDDRFVIKHISSKELQSFLGCLPGYFRYMASIYFDGRTSLLSKTVGLYHTTIIQKNSGQKVVRYICVMENAFYRKQILRAYDLKGSIRNRFTKLQLPSKVQSSEFDDRVLLDGNFLEFTKGYPMGILAEDQHFILKAVQNDTEFLSSINIVDYSMVLGLSYLPNDTGTQQRVPSKMTLGIIDYLRQFDLIKRVESVGKSVGMIAGQSSPTIIEPNLYGKRFRDAINRYFMPVSPIASGTNDDIKATTAHVYT